MAGRNTGGRYGINHPSNLDGDRAIRAQVRQDERQGRTPTQQLAILNLRLGLGIGAVKERQRLDDLVNGRTVNLVQMEVENPICTIIPVGPQAEAYAHRIALACANEKVRVCVDSSKRKIGVKKRTAETFHVGIVGIKEVHSESVSLCVSDDEKDVPLNNFIRQMLTAQTEMDSKE